MKIFLTFLLLCISSSVFAVNVNYPGEKKEDPLCTKYKERLKKYQREGVMGINPVTGKRQKMKGKQARSAIQDTKENIEILCK